MNSLKFTVVHYSVHSTLVRILVFLEDKNDTVGVEHSSLWLEENMLGMHVSQEFCVVPYSDGDPMVTVNMVVKITVYR